MRRNIFAAVCCLFIGITTVGCGESSGDGDGEGGDSLTIGGGDDDNSGTALVVEDIGEAEENYSPGSLEVDESSLVLEGAGPCEGVDSFIACQPNLLKEFLNIGKRNLGVMSEVIEDTADIVNNVEVGKGEINVDDAPGVESIKYNVTSAEKYKLAMISEKGPFAFLSVNREDEDLRVYLLSFNFDNFSDEFEGGEHEEGGDEGHDDEQLDDGEGEDPSGFMRLSLVIKDGTDFILNQKMGPMDCDDEDVRAPQNIAIDIVVKDGLHKGKATLFHPRWRTSDSATCDLTPTQNTELILMYDFAGNDTFSTTNVFMTKRNVGIDELSDYALDNICDNFDGLCSGNEFDGDDVSKYANPLCISNDENSFGGACSDIPISSLSDNDRFAAPADVLGFDSDFPETDD